MELNQVTLSAKDLSRSVDFYRTLGLELIVDTPHYARFMCPMGKSSFSLVHEPECTVGGATIYFEHPELDNWYMALIRQGIQFITPPTDKDYLWREAELKDPSGHKIKLYYAGENRLNPPWKVTE